MISSKEYLNDLSQTKKVWTPKTRAGVQTLVWMKS